MIQYNVDNLEDLRIFKVIEHSTTIHGLEGIPNQNIKLLDLQEKPWVYLKGKKQTRDYCYQGELIAQVKYNYQAKAGVITSWQKSIIWYKITADNSPVVGITKTIEKDLTKKKVIAINRAVRQNQIDYLTGSGDGLREDAQQEAAPIKTAYLKFADSVDALFVRYQHEIREYIDRGTATLYTTIQNEATTPFSQILDTNHHKLGISIRQIILYQLR